MNLDGEWTGSPRKRNVLHPIFCCCSDFFMLRSGNMSNAMRRWTEIWHRIWMWLGEPLFFFGCFGQILRVFDAWQSGPRGNEYKAAENNFFVYNLSDRERSYNLSFKAPHASPYKRWDTTKWDSLEIPQCQSVSFSF